MTPKTIRRGNNIVVEYTVLDQTQDPAVPLDPDTSIVITLYDPSSAVIVNQQPMTRITTGRYRRQYQSQVTDPLGSWRAEVRVSHSSNIGISDKDIVFVLVA